MRRNRASPVEARFAEAEPVSSLTAYGSRLTLYGLRGKTMLEVIVGKYNYWMYIVLMMIGFYAMIAKNNLVKKIIGMNIFQTAIILFFISIAFKKGGATLPIIEHGPGHGADHGAAALDHAAPAAEHAAHAAEAVSNYLNPLPHVLMLTAIVVMVATLGVALAIMIRIYKQYNTLEEDEILRKLS